MKTKKILCLQNLCAMLLTASLILSKPVFSYSKNVIPPIQSGDWLYYDMGDWVSVCGYLGKEEHITIPSSIDGKKVTELCYNNADADGDSTVQLRENCFFGSYGSDLDDREAPEPVTKRVTIPDTVTRIGDYTFFQCKVLEQVDMPQGLKAIGDGAFESCVNLSKADIPTGTEIIGIRAFCVTSIDNLVIPDTVSYIGALAFALLPVTKLEIPDTVKYIGNSAFLSCIRLETVKLPKGIKEIPSGLFVNCQKLESVEIPDTVRIIGESAFEVCIGLKSVKLPKGITKIPSNLFSGCSSLKSAEIPEGVQTIGSGAFANCTSLEEVYLPATLKSAADIFLENPALKSISFAADEDTVKALMGVNILKGNMAMNDDTAYYDNVQIHYGEKAAVPEGKTAEEIIRDILKVSAIIFSSLFLIVLCLTIIQKAALKPKKADRGGNVLTKFNSPDMITCKRCGTASGKEAKYCCNCGKKLTAKLSKGKGKEQLKK